MQTSSRNNRFNLLRLVAALAVFVAHGGFLYRLHLPVPVVGGLCFLFYQRLCDMPELGATARLARVLGQASDAHIPRACRGCGVFSVHCGLVCDDAAFSRLLEGLWDVGQFCQQCRGVSHRADPAGGI